ncbi:MAG: tetratricopeptide repeat protein [Pseudomonadota bacterium]
MAAANTMFRFESRALLFTLVVLGVAPTADAIRFPHLDYSAHLERGLPGPESFGTLVDPPREAEPMAVPPGDRSDRTITPGMDAVIVRYDEALAERRYLDAIGLAEQLLEQIETDLGRDHVEYSHALSDLGAAHHHAGSPQAAIEPLRASIRGISAAEGIYSPNLVGPQAYLGAALQALGEHRDALDELTRAQHLTHRHDGALNLDQLKIVHAKAASLEATGEFWETEQLLRLVLRVNEHHYGATALESLPARWQLAEWLTHYQRYQPALSVYGDAIRLLESKGETAGPAMLQAMRGMAQTYLLQQSVDVDRGLTLTREIAAMIEAAPDRFDLPTRIQAQLELGDWLILFDREDEAWEAYERAWALARDDNSQDWTAFLAEPRLIYAGPNLTVDFMGYQVIGTEVYNDFAFRVRPDGRPSHVKVLDSNLSVLTRRRSIAFLRDARFRPALASGAPVSTREHRLRRYYPTPAPDDYGQVSFNGSSGYVPMSNYERRWPTVR